MLVLGLLIPQQHPSDLVVPFGTLKLLPLLPLPVLPGWHGAVCGVQDRDSAARADGTLPKCHFFNSFFLNKMYLDQQPEAYCYANVKRWTNPKRLAVWGQVCHDGYLCIMN